MRLRPIMSVIVGVLLAIASPAQAEDLGSWAFHHKLGVEAVEAGDYRTAEQAFREAIEASDHFRDDDPRRATTLNNMGYVLYSLGELRQARSFFEQSMVLRRTVLGEKHPLVADSLANLGEVARTLGDFDRAARLHEQALEIRRIQFPEAHPNIAMSLNDLGVLAFSEQEFEKSLSLHQQALDIRRQSFGENHPTTAISLGNLAATHHAAGNFERALAFLDRELAALQESVPADDLRIAASLTNRSRTLLELDGRDLPHQALERALAVRTTKLGAFHPETAETQEMLAESLLASGSPARAAELARTALQIREEFSESSIETVWLSRDLLARARSAMGDHDAAAAIMAEIIAEVRAMNLIDDAVLAVYLNNSAIILHRKGAFRDALNQLNEAVVLEEGVFGLDGSPLVNSLRNLATVLASLEQPNRAQLALARANAIARQARGLEGQE